MAFLLLYPLTLPHPTATVSHISFTLRKHQVLDTYVLSPQLLENAFIVSAEQILDFVPVGIIIEAADATSRFGAAASTTTILTITEYNLFHYMI